jgi:hypothetical protein
MAEPILADSGTDSRAKRALRLFEERGSLIRAVAADTFEVPSCALRGKRYTVRYGGGVESCTCKDYQFGHICKHLLAVGVMHAARRSGVREVRTVGVAAGDPFRAAAKRKGCPACFGGYVTITTEDDNIARDEAVPCRRCHGETL